VRAASRSAPCGVVPSSSAEPIGGYSPDNSKRSDGSGQVEFGRAELRLEKLALFLQP
jgi:hypothetical protein